MMTTIVSSSPKLRDIDKNEKNKFWCNWLEKKKINLELGEKETDVSVQESIKYVDVRGKVLCILCNDSDMTHFCGNADFSIFGIRFYHSWNRCRSA
ncbi:hypothetical protein AVEN_263954-1 [Araneus ventricosus]|uniref:Uncharacterized protein n=1 Tax=Araneus ventricosus TaxID=182803 RepID=A0A4Y2HNE9_ARAVE|nr:hypothetical protein AVEN_263954-1 [Araneus ventricosus]